MEHGRGGLGGREVQLYERDRVPHSTKKYLDRLHVNAELHRGRYAGTFYQKRQAGPGMESGILHVAAKDLIHLGDNLRMFVFVESMQFGLDAKTGGCTYHVTFHPASKKAFLAFLSSRLDRRFTYEMTSTPIRTASQQERKETLRSLRITAATAESEKKKHLDTLQAGVLCNAIRRGDTNCIQDKMNELGEAILNMPLDACGMTMLHYSAQRQLYDVLYFLKQKQPSTKGKTWWKKIRLADGRTPMDLLMRTKRTDAFWICFHVLENTELLEAAKAQCEPYVRFAVSVMKLDVNATNSFGMTCLHYCFSNKKRDEESSRTTSQLAEFLVQHGADIYAQNTVGVKAIDACKNRQLRDRLQTVFKERNEASADEEKKKRSKPQQRQNALRQAKDKPVAAAAPVGAYWGQETQTGLLQRSKGRIPDVASREFGTWYSTTFRQWPNHVSIVSSE